MTTKCYVNCEVELDGEGYSYIFRIKNVTPEPLYKVYVTNNLPSSEIDYGETANVSIQSVYNIK